MHVAGGVATIETVASYFAGGALPNAEVDWKVTAVRGRYSPPNWSDFSFGAFPYHPWLGTGGSTETFDATTGADGAHRLELDLSANLDVDPSPVVITADAGVTDVNRQKWSDSTMLLVHPADRYVGVRTDKPFVQRGESLTIDAVVTDVDGEAVAGSTISVEFARVVGRWTGTSWATEELDTQTCSITSAAQPASCSMTPESGGQWVIRARITDADGRPNLAELTRWVGGGRLVSSDRVQLETVELVPDRTEYQPGDTASILVVSPFETGHGLMTIARNGILDQRSFEISGGSAEVDVVIGEKLLPNVSIQVELVGSAQRVNRLGEPVAGAQRPAYAAGSVDLSVPASSRELSLQVTPASTELRPGDAASVNVQVTDSSGGSGSWQRGRSRRRRRSRPGAERLRTQRSAWFILAVDRCADINLVWAAVDPACFI